MLLFLCLSRVNFFVLCGCELREFYSLCSCLLVMVWISYFNFTFTSMSAVPPGLPDLCRHCSLLDGSFCKNIFRWDRGEGRIITLFKEDLLTFSIASFFCEYVIE